MTSSEFQQITHTIPSDPGIYKYYDRKNELIYVGKAKNLRKRVSSYFIKTFTNYKTHELVQRIEQHRIHYRGFRAGCFLPGKFTDQTISSRGLILT